PSALPSFPTRRSSDLLQFIPRQIRESATFPGLISKLLFPQQPQSDGPDHQDSSHTHKSSGNRRECGNQHGCGTRHLSVKRAVCKDRKSTRLNSSHVKI